VHRTLISTLAVVAGALVLGGCGMPPRAALPQTTHHSTPTPNATATPAPPSSVAAIPCPDPSAAPRLPDVHVYAPGHVDRGYVRTVIDTDGALCVWGLPYNPSAQDVELVVDTCAERVQGPACTVNATCEAARACDELRLHAPTVDVVDGQAIVGPVRARRGCIWVTVSWQDNGTFVRADSGRGFGGIDRATLCS
jgi:hypothetical protein